MLQVGQDARAASRKIASADTRVKSTALKAIGQALLDNRAGLLAANKLDLEAAAANGLAQPLVDRLVLGDKGIQQMVAGVLEVESLGDPVGEISEMRYMPSGIRVGRMRVPLGVIGIIYESRPNVTVDAASLCLKAGNACILRGGSEAFHSNTAIALCIRKGLLEAGLPETVVQVIDTTDRAAVGALLKLEDYVDVLIPRGGRGLIERVSQESKIPVIKHLDGICHLYIDEGADTEMAINIAVNSKAEKYAVCNALETLLVAESMADKVLPELDDRFSQLGVELRGCERTLEFMPAATAASDEDWATEYLGPVLSVRVVQDLDVAIDHIARYGSQHTDCIVSNNHANTQRFLTEVDSASVLVNVSTQFADGFEYGLGAEIGISTDKIHARGPVGLEGMTSQKFIVLGQGEIRIR